jgi:hypothetical protein
MSLMPDTLSFATLKEKQRAIRAGFPETMGLRVHRAISWIGRAEACDGDDDARFIFLWIAFNAAYADEREFQSIPQGERAAFLDYFGRLTTLDTERRIYKAVWQRSPGQCDCFSKTAMSSIRSGSTITGSTGSRIGMLASRHQPSLLHKRFRLATALGS